MYMSLLTKAIARQNIMLVPLTMAIITQTKYGINESSWYIRLAQYSANKKRR
jgi:hypothetical protein